MEVIISMILLIGCVICICIVASKGINISITVKHETDPEIQPIPLTEEQQKQLEEQQRMNQELAAHVQKVLGVFQDE